MVWGGGGTGVVLCDDFCMTQGSFEKGHIEMF